MGSVVERVASRLPLPLRGPWRLTARTVVGSARDRVPGLAAEVAFFTLLSLPALLLMVLGTLGFVAQALGPEGAAELNRLLFDVPRTFLTERTYDSWEHIARSIVQEGQAGVVSFGALLSLWTGSRAVARMVETVAIAYDVEDHRPIWRRRLLALGLTLAGLLVGATVLPTLVIGPYIVGLVAPASIEQAAERLVEFLFWPSTAVLVLLALATFYHVAAPWHTPWRRDLPGAVLTVVIWMLAAAGLRLYIRYTLDSEGVFAQLALPLAVVLWLYITAFAVLLGAELNAEIEKLWPYRRFPWRLKRSRR